MNTAIKNHIILKSYVQREGRGIRLDNIAINTVDTNIRNKRRKSFK